MKALESMRTATVIGLVAAAACAKDARILSGPASTRSPQFAVLSAASAAAGAPTGRHLVSFTAGAPADFAAQVRAAGGTVLWVSSDAGLASVSGLQESGAAALARRQGIQSLVADVAIALDDPGVRAARVVAPDAIASQVNPAAAFFFGLQWNLLAVRADAAWAAGFRGQPNVSVFILDSGIDYRHFDLRTLVDLTRSVDLLGTFLTPAVVNGDTVIVSFTEADTVAKYFSGREPFTDLFFHGTHVAATVSSRALVTAGVTSQTTLVAVKVCAYINACPFSSILGGVIYAADHGADVINLSLGGAFPKAGNGRFVGFINKVFNYARSRGVTIVVAAGNESADLDHDGNSDATFCSTPAVICVAATGPTAQASDFGPWTNVDAPAFYTNFGRSAINVAAPGGNNRVTFVWAACSETIYPPLAAELHLEDCLTFPTVIIGLEGTSMAAPHVSGAAALLVPIVGRSPARIKARLQQSADNVAGNGTSPFYGKGRLNIGRAVGAIP